MKHWRNVLVLALAAAMLLGCAGTAFAAAKDDEAVAAAVEKLEAAQSYAMDMALTMEFSMAGERVRMQADYRLDAINDPAKVKMDMTMRLEAGGESETVKLPMYVLENGDALALYMKPAQEWMRVDIPLAELEQAAPAGLAARGTFDGLTGFYKSANARVYGHPAVQYTARLKWDEAAKLMQDMDFSAMTGLAGEDAALYEEAFAALGDVFSGMFKGIPDTEVKLYIDDATGLPVRYDVALGSVLQKALENVFMEAFKQAGMRASERKAAWKELALSVEKYDLVMEISNVNGVKDFKLPAAAKRAKAAANADLSAFAA